MLIGDLRKRLKEIMKEDQVALNTLEQLELIYVTENQRLAAEVNKYKTKWEIEVDRYNDLIEKIMEKIK